MPLSRRICLARRTRAYAAPACAALLAATACGADRATAPEPVTPTPPPAAPAMAPAAREHLGQLLDLVQAHSLRRLTIDWPAFRVRVLAAAPGAQSVVDTYPAVYEALALLGDGHSSYRSALGVVLAARTRACRASGAAVDRTTLPPDVGYVRVDAFSGADAAATVFATWVQDSIRAADRDGLAGWVVDLRGNGGGNMWPMLAGIGPVLGEGTLGHFVDPAGAALAWEYRGGAALLGGVAQERVPSPYRLRRERPRVAVLLDGGVASSGEAVAIAFRRRPETRAFGAATCGLSTANATFLLRDGASLNVAAAVMADRARTPYGDAVAPDEPIADPAEALRRAVAWLREGR